MGDDAALLHDYASRRDEAAFAKLVQRHLGMVYFAALRRCGGDTHRAEEVTQDVFTLLANQAPKLQRHAVLAGWLYVTARNVAANLLRNEKSRHAREVGAWVMSDYGDNTETETGIGCAPCSTALSTNSRNAIAMRSYFAIFKIGHLRKLAPRSM